MKTMRAKHMYRKLWITRAASILLIGWIFSFIIASVYAADGVSTVAGPEGPAQTAYAPANGKLGPVIIAISGNNGPALYQSYAAALAELGYCVVLVDGKDILNPEHTGPANLKKVIDRAQRSPSAVKGKVAVIGFSLGGGGALYSAANMPNVVSMVVAYYPSTRTWSNNIDSLAKRFQVPVLLLAAERDSHKGCCLIETARAIEVAAKANGGRFELVVYPEADHGFNLASRAYRQDDDRDAWHRTIEMLKRYQPLRQK